jgi:hypothetical protein
MKTRWSEQRATAIHEAGHATVAFLFNRAFTSVSVVSNADSLGRVCHRPPGDWFRPDIEITRRTTRFAQDYIMMLLAGHAAQGAWCRGTVGAPNDWSDTNDQQAQQDFENAYDLAEHVTGSPRQAEAYLEWLQIRTADQVKHPLASRLVEGLADELERVQTLSWRKASAHMKALAASEVNDRDWKAVRAFTAGPYL